MRIEKTSRALYQFTELSDEAKETAREWYRGCIESDELADYDDWQAIAAILGVEFRMRDVKLMGGGTRQDPAIYWSGFCSQGDGASWEGCYSYAKAAPKRIRDYAPQDERLHSIADRLLELQRRNFYQLQASSTVSGHYVHSGCMRIAVERKDERAFNGNDEESLIQCLRDFADWIYRQLEAQWDYLNSDEAVDDSIHANEYEFTESGDIA